MANFQTGRPLNVAMFSDHIAAQPEDAVYELARGLAAEGADVDIFTLQRGGERDFEMVDGFRVHRTGSVDLMKPLRLRTSLAPKFFPQALGYLRDNPPDVIHAHGTSYSAVVAACVARMLRRPLVTTLGGGPLDTPALRRRLPRLAYHRSVGRAIVRSSDRVVCTNAAAAEHASNLGVSPNRLTALDGAAEAGRSGVVREIIDLYVDTLAERELRWFLQRQAA